MVEWQVTNFSEILGEWVAQMIILILSRSFIKCGSLLWASVLTMKLVKQKIELDTKKLQQMTTLLAHRMTQKCVLPKITHPVLYKHSARN